MPDKDWHKYRNTDPYFDKIAPALLNSHDISLYASKGCLVGDFDENRLLPAGYKMRFLGDLRYWEHTKNRSLSPIKQSITSGEEVILRRNSITYLHMEEEFRMPQYIAARFNLRITHVHQGLLLGTGPLIDPGFEGRIMIPLHNLTDNDYSLIGGKSIIHVEFTKLSMLERWREDVEANDVDDNYEPFQEGKLESTPEDYFNKSQVRAKGGVVSNLKSALSDAEELNDRTRRRLRVIEGFGIGAAVAILIGGYNLVQSTNKVLHGVNETALKAQSTLAEVRSILNSELNIVRSETGGVSSQQNPVAGAVGVDEGATVEDQTATSQDNTVPEEDANIGSDPSDDSEISGDDESAPTNQP